MTEEFRKRLLENLKKYAYLPYKLSFNKNMTDGFYCSQYIWLAYKDTAKELGYDLDLDSDNGFIVFPYDFLESEHLYFPKE